MANHYSTVLRQRVQQALAAVQLLPSQSAQAAAILRRIATEVVLGPRDRLTGHPLPGTLEHRIELVLTHLLNLERNGFAKEIAAILREIADKLDPPGEDSSGSR